MKTFYSILSRLMLTIFLAFAFMIVFAQEPPPPPPGHDAAGNVPGGGVAIGSGIALLIALGAAYGAKKVYNFRNGKPDS
jgi:hypothetical protein